MATIIERPRKDGTTAFFAQIVVKRGGVIVRRENRTFSGRGEAEAWASQRQAALSGRANVAKISDALGFVIPEHIAYPPVPQPTIAPSRDGDGLPAACGVYFFWREGRVEYVGKSVNIKGRARVGRGHLALADHHRISFILVDAAVLNFAECFYIGVLRPVLNFKTGRSRLSARRSDDSIAAT